MKTEAGFLIRSGTMHSPVKDSEPSDFQQLYRKHVHENMLLHERMRSMASVERSKLRQLNTDAAMFKGKYTKYLKQQQGSTKDACRAKGDQKQCRHRSAFFICKNFAYPSKAWHDLVDVSKYGLDMYKAEVLANNVGETPEKNSRVTKSIHRDSAGILTVYNTPGQTSNLTDSNAGKANTDNVNQKGRFDKYEPVRQNTLPSIVVSENEAKPVGYQMLPLTRELTDIIGKWKSDNSLSSGELPLLNEPSSGETQTSRRPSTNQSPRESKRPSSTTPDDNDGYLTVPTYRGRCHTIGTTPRPSTPLLGRRRSSARRHSVMSQAEVGSGWKKLKKKAKMISVSLSLLHDAREIEIARTAKSFEDLSHCRYLRLEDDKSFTLGRDNMTYSREKLNSSCEDIH